jgi:hypothetical protein
MIWDNIDILGVRTDAPNTHHLIDSFAPYSMLWCSYHLVFAYIIASVWIGKGGERVYYRLHM